MKYFYKIRNVKTGLYKDAGSNPNPNSTWGWSKTGKVWKNLPAVMQHFALYRKNKVLEMTDWVIELYPAEPTEIISVVPFLMDRWGITK